MEDFFVKVTLPLVLLVVVSAEIYYVTPSSNTTCPEEDGAPCFTLSQYANKSSDYFASNTTLILLPGNHSLDQELSIGHITLLSVESDTTSGQSDTTVSCNESARLIFESISVVSMRGLVLFGCVNNEVNDVIQFTLDGCSLIGQQRKGTGLSLNEVNIANIMRSSLTYNKGWRIVDEHGRSFGIGGAIIVRKSRLGITISDCKLNHNIVNGHVGGAIYADSLSHISIINSTLNNNSVNGDHGSGGAVSIFSSHISIINSTLNNNSVNGDFGSGGAVSIFSSKISIINSTLNKNTVTRYGFGGAIYVNNSSLFIIDHSIINNNAVAGGVGGAVFVNLSIVIIIRNSTLNDNSITVSKHGAAGGALYAADSSNITVVSSSLNSNTVTATQDKGTEGAYGGAVYADSIQYFTVINSTLDNNTVTGNDGVAGGTMFATSSRITLINSTLNNNTLAITSESSMIHLISCVVRSSGFLEFHDNMASAGLLYAIDSVLNLSGNITASNNYGSSFFVYSSKVTFMGYTNIVNNSYVSDSSQEGGAVSGFQSEIMFIGRVNLMYNIAVRGGAIAATQSKLYFHGDVKISHNSASESGGGIYAYQSELNFKRNITISENTADNRGGGIHAISSTTKLTHGSHTYISGNYAKRGGGLCLEGSAKIYLLKKATECKKQFHKYCNLLRSSWTTLHLSKNTAEYGGAVYVADNTSSAACYVTPFSKKITTSNECFLQNLSLFKLIGENVTDRERDTLSLNILNSYFTENSATESGSVLYGGLLDRCGASPFAEIFQVYRNWTQSTLNAVSYIINITDLEDKDFNSTEVISSDPVRVCFCKDNQPDCSYHPQPKHVRKGEMFTVSLVAVDHINNTIANSTIHASVSTEAKLGEGQSIQLTSESCTDLSYSILSPRNSEMLHLYADGPCMNAGISTANLSVLISACPTGFKDIDLRCKCDPLLYPEYVSDCSIDNKTVLRKDNVWFAYVDVNTTHHQGYMLHKYCPFDYCLPPTKNVSVNLNIEDGSNELCTYNRSGKLCGSCKDGLSLSLGSSRCRPCSNSWFALLIGFAIAGIVLVAFVLELNFTVAVGTINGLIFYANIFAANRAIFFPRYDTKLLTVFIAWLNLDFGFETCFYNGLDGYFKTWLQFVFPLYVISLVVAIIIISDYSTKFARLFTGKNPIATLATLILLSYTKLLRTIIASLSYTKLQYSDGSHEIVWLIDANIPYLSGKHIPLFISALVVVMVGIVYTLVLFAWQWLVYCPNRGPLRWIISNTKVIAFMDAYHNPYNKNHRYWIGLLLLVRVVLYLVSALKVFGDPLINLYAIALATTLLAFFQRTIECKSKIHKSRLIERLETVSLLNLAGVTISSIFIKYSQNVVSYISIGIAFATFLVILVYHMYQFVLKRLLKMIADKFGTHKRAYCQVVVESAIPKIPSEEEPVSVTEVNALPEPIDICTEEDVTNEAYDSPEISVEMIDAVMEPDTQNEIMNQMEAAVLFETELPNYHQPLISDS